MTEWICVLNKLSFGSAAYPDFVCLRRDTFLQKIKNDYLEKSGGMGAKVPPAPLVAPPLDKAKQNREDSMCLFLQKLSIYRLLHVKREDISKKV